MNIHFAIDVVFINKAVELFEKYDPGNNVFYIISKRPGKKKFIHVSPAENIFHLDMLKRRVFRKIRTSIQDGDKIFVHYLNQLTAAAVLKSIHGKDVKTHWIFFGSDLYEMLENRGVYDLYDPGNDFSKKGKRFFRLVKNTLLSIQTKMTMDRVRERFINRLDYFCFWNPHDYQLLIKHFETRARFRNFRYFITKPPEVTDNLFRKKAGFIVINHSASRHGNHLSLIARIAELDEAQSLEKVIVPLSYGPEKVIRQVKAMGTKLLPYCFTPLTTFLPSDQYFALLNNASAAVFGHRRQEGSGNIFQFLAAGTKVFLREENNMLLYLREKGYHVFSYEKELLALSDLEPLEKEKQVRNRTLLLEELSTEKQEKVFKDILHAAN